LSASASSAELWSAHEYSSTTRFPRARFVAERREVETFVRTSTASMVDDLRLSSAEKTKSGGERGEEEGYVSCVEERRQVRDERTLVVVEDDKVGSGVNVIGDSAHVEAVVEAAGEK
jgi:hypothetical protein